jgi:hypothetical protein
MVRTTTAACLLALMSLIAAAQTVPTPRTEFLDRLQSSVIKSIGAQDNTVEITLANSILTVLRVNSNQNGSTHAGRNNEATSIAVVASKAISADAASTAIHTIRVQYLTRDSAHPEGDIIDSVEFRKNAKGVFDIHVS